MRTRHALLLALAACDPASPIAADDEPGLEPADAAPSPAADEPARVCDIAAPRDVAALAVSAAGVVLGVPSAHADGPPLLLHRWHGDGCDLAPDGDLPIAAGALLDLDDRGNVYAFPAEPGPDAARSTMLPNEDAESFVARVDVAGHVRHLLPAGRGIWSFGVAPDGDALWVSGCGPNGLYAIASADVTPDMPAPDTLWAQYPSVLTAARTFWSVGFPTCLPGEPLTPSCGLDLVRTTPAGSAALASTLVDLGAGREPLTLARCGARVCGRGLAGVIVWDDAGAEVHRRTSTDLSARPGEQVMHVGGGDRGLYVLLHGERGGRVVFVPLAPT